ncbi:unnamed protein product [Paramecium sonneborni]|uniref:Uncharacterized protein n=1 Tax=Paramecium sonneborni TaxID=65129 RepID=A0A8S1RMB9_9CILI|nr:unnamed protein product [Paramecium sonneborni]
MIFWQSKKANKPLPLKKEFIKNKWNFLVQVESLKLEGKEDKAIDFYGKYQKQLYSFFLVQKDRFQEIWICEILGQVIILQRFLFIQKKVYTQKVHIDQKKQSIVGIKGLNQIKINLDFTRTNQNFQKKKITNLKTWYIRGINQQLECQLKGLLL